jgi:hypothetical protein
MANKIKSLVWEVDVEPKVPSMTSRSDPRLLAETRRLLAFEFESASRARRVGRDKSGPLALWRGVVICRRCR